MLGIDHDEYVPRQLYQLGAAGVECRLIAPAAELAPFVHYYWALRVGAERIDLPVIPDNAIDLVVCPALADFAALYFPVESAYEIALEGPVEYIGICLRIDRIERVLGLSSKTLRRLAAGVETCDALALRPLVARLGDAGASGAAAPETLGACIDEFFHRYDRRDRGAAVEASLFEGFLDTLEPARVAALAHRAGISERQLRRETRRLFGLSPKKIQRIVRLQRAIGELIDGTPSRADYHDDSHRIRELRALTGWTPGEIRRLAETYNTHRHPSPRLCLPTIHSRSTRR